MIVGVTFDIPEIINSILGYYDNDFSNRPVSAKYNKAGQCKIKSEETEQNEENIKM